MKVRVYKILKNTNVEGPNTRYCIWFQGCSKRCKGCWAKQTWDFNKGAQYDTKDIIKEILSNKKIEGVTFLGGEPSRTVSSLNDINTGVMHLDNDAIEKIQKKEFETQFVDKDTSIKTITEHGGEIIGQGEYTVECQIEDFFLSFTKTQNSPYKVRIEYKGSEQVASDLIKEISSEYVYNTQEASYNKIIENLEEKNLQYEEEVYDDDSIVITVNLD